METNKPSHNPTDDTISTNDSNDTSQNPTDDTISTNNNIKSAEGDIKSVDGDIKSAEGNDNNNNKNEEVQAVVVNATSNKFQWVLLAIIVVLIAYIYGISRPVSALHCPNDIYHVQIPQKHYYIDASHPEHLSSVTYQWEVKKKKVKNPKKKPRIYDKDKAKLQFDRVQTAGEYVLELQMDAPRMSPKICKITAKLIEIPLFGIDLGTTFSCIAYRDSRKDIVIVVAIKEWHEGTEYCIPTAIYFPKDMDEKIKIGYDALQYLQTDPHNVIFDIKRIIGRRKEEKEVQQFINNKAHQFKLTDDEYPNIIIPNRGITITPEQALSAILIHLVEAASGEFDAPYSTNVVVSIPAFFHNGPRKAIRSACHLAGLNPQKLVVEPSAAALAFMLEDKLPENNLVPFLVFDFGGGTLDCSIVRCKGVDCRIQAVSGDPALGGIDFDNVVVDIIENKLHNDRYKPLSKHYIFTDKEQGLIKTEAEQFKIILSSDLSASSHILINGNNYRVSISRENDFYKHSGTKELIDRAIQIAKDAVSKAVKYSLVNKINFIVLVGGSSKIPLVQKEIRKHFENKNLRIVYPKRDPQHLVVAGGAIIADRLECYTSNTDINCPALGISDVIPLSLGFATCIGKPPASVLSQHIIDLVYIVDATASMTSWIKQVKKDINTLISKLEKKFNNQNVKFRVAGVGYRDWGDTKRIESINFTEDISSFKKWLNNKLKATGGGSEAEDVLGGLMSAVSGVRLSWSSDATLKLVIHILDAPPHGRIFSSVSDEFPDGHSKDPVPNNPEKYYKHVLDKFNDEGIELMIVKLESVVDKMAKLFKSYGSKIGMKLYDTKLDWADDLDKLLPETESFLSGEITNKIRAAPTTGTGAGAYSEDSTIDGEYKCDVMDVVIPKNEIYPITRTKKYCTYHSKATEAEFQLFEGDELDTKENYFLANIIIKDVPKGSCKSSMIEVVFNIDTDGIATITATINDKSFVLTVETQDGRIKPSEIGKYKMEMMNWFESDVIQTVLRTSTQKSIFNRMLSKLFSWFV